MNQLYYSPGAASLLVHWLLLELDLPHELRLVDIAAGAQKQPDYLALNPSGVVPTLVVDGEPLVEAAALAMTLADRHPAAGLAPAPTDPQRAHYTQWMFHLANAVQPLFRLWWYPHEPAGEAAHYTQWMFHLANAVQPLFRLWWYPHEPAGEANADVVRAEVAPKIEAAWDRIEAHLAANGPYLLGNALSAADFYLTMLMRWSRNMPRPATEWPHLAALAQRMKARPSFNALYASEGLTEWA